LFGTKNSEGKKEPFHVYSMKQAIEEGFILDILENYMTYKTYYRVNKKIKDDPEFEKSRTSKEIARFVSLHPHNISQKTEIMIEHFRDKTQHKIGGEAKAMLVTSSRLHAVRYKIAFDKYIREHGYNDLNTLVAFSGTVKDNGDEFTESKMNEGIPESETAKEFDKDEYQVLLVANKYQTGFDQPKLHTMFVDKRLRGVNAVQTLSRLNRTYKGIKEDTFVLDFVNEADDIKKAFEPYYEITKLSTENINPNEMYTLYDEIMDSMLINKDDVETFAKVYYENDNKEKIISAGANSLSHSLDRINELSKDEKLEFRSKMKKFISLYMLVLQVHPIKDSDLHKLNVYLRFLLKRIDLDTPGKVDISDKVILEYYQIEEQGEKNINLVGEDNELYTSVSGGSLHEQEKEYLSIIIERLNERFQTDFSESAKVATEQVTNNMKDNEELKRRAKVNTLEDFKISAKKEFKDEVVKSYNENTEFYGRILNDQEFRERLLDLIIVDLYRSFNEE
jgi:type I restriction enzyme R subunit